MNNITFVITSDLPLKLNCEPVEMDSGLPSA